jgi:predicted nucleic acid-binding protein
MAKPFIDSNVVLYLFSSDTVKADRAESLLQSGGLISVQVLNEVASVCLRKLKMTWEDIDAVLKTLKSSCEVLPVTLASHEKAVGLAKRFQISLYDANIVATAILCGADTLFSEDMQNGMSMESVTVVHPFCVWVLKKCWFSKQTKWLRTQMNSF